MAEGTSPSTMPYFFGRISRDEAEKVLVSFGCTPGMYLLRESMAVSGNYALSICHDNKVHHYSIESQPDGTVMIPDGRKFKGPVELINHHRQNLDGFLTRPTIACNRPEGTAPMAWPYVTMLELEQALLEKAQAMKKKDHQLANLLGPQRQYFINMVAKELHKDQPWFHGRIERDAADKIMRESGHTNDGKFIIRDRNDPKLPYALSLSYHGQTKHYKITAHRLPTGEIKLSIEDGPRFDNLMDLVAHYHNKAEGLLSKLTEPCYRRGFEKKKVQKMDANPFYGDLPPALPGANRWSSEGATNGLPPSSARPLPPKPVPYIFGDDIWDEPELPDVSQSGSMGGSEDQQKIYDEVPRTEDMFNLKKRDIELQEKLGSGNFGSVMKGMYRHGGKAIPVAVKTLKQDEVSNAESELMREAKVMAKLEHRNIVRMIGVCRADSIMLVLELAQLGPLNKYLKKNPSMLMKNIIEIMFQVAEGMDYLEKQNFVHRDLAARNVLLVSDKFAKISDFGMSKALGIGNEYYKAVTAGKWPLKWYAPECIYYFKFDSKSDVWSYGVTLWEATSYGAKPYKGLRGCQILELLSERGERLPKPPQCPPGVYERVMLPCWKVEKDERPTFAEIVELLRKFAR